MTNIVILLVLPLALSAPDSPDFYYCWSLSNIVTLASNLAAQRKPSKMPAIKNAQFGPRSPLPMLVNSFVKGFLSSIKYSE